MGFVFSSSSVTVSTNVGGLRWLSAVARRNWLPTHLNIPNITLKDAPCELDLVLSSSLPFFSAPGFFLRSNDPVNGLFYSVNDDPIAVLNQCNWSSQDGLGNDVTDDKSPRSPREPTVCNQRRLSTKTSTHQSTRWPQHLSSHRGFRDCDRSPPS
jgi:hypothetical protein